MEDFYLPPGSVVTIRATDWICNRALAAGWLALTTDVSVGRVVIVTRPLWLVETGVAGWHVLTLDQLRPAVIPSLGWWKDGLVVGFIRPRPQSTPTPSVSRRPLNAKDWPIMWPASAWPSPRTHGSWLPASGQAFRLWQAGRFTSLQALLAWQIGELMFASQTVLDLQALAWPERLHFLSALIAMVAIWRVAAGRGGVRQPRGSAQDRPSECDLEGRCGTGLQSLRARSRDLRF